MQQNCDTSFITRSLRAIRAAGYRLTRQRRQIVQALAAAAFPLSISDVEKALRESGERADRVTVYRVLEVLQGLDLVHRVASTGRFFRCTLGSLDACHGYVVCRSCGSLQEFADRSLCRKEDEVAAKLGFQAERHLSEFSGLCEGCRG